ncbi:MAG: hypothetical protein Q8O72_08375 [Bacteroidales bacterium]|nr:hypothetical protein [Bacteroidales bacterium]
MKTFNVKRLTKAIVLTAGAAILVSGGLMLNGCKKDTRVESEPNANIDKLKTSSVMTAEDSLFSRKIVLFDGIMENYKTIPNYSLNKHLSIDSAVYYLEIWFNAKYAFPDESFINVVHRDTAISITLNQGLVAMDGIYSKIASIKSLTTDKYRGLGFSKKALILVHLKQLSASSLSQIDFELHMVFGELGTKERVEDPFGSDDYWKYGQLLGKCDYSGEGDAGVLIQNELNTMDFLPLVSPPPGYSFSYGIIEYIERDGSEYDNIYDPIPGDNDLDKLIFFRTDNPPDYPLTIADECLDPTTMNFHYHGNIEVITDKIPVDENKPANWTFRECELVGEYFTFDHRLTLHHKSTYGYALRYLVRNDWIEVDNSFLTK